MDGNIYNIPKYTNSLIERIKQDVSLSDANKTMLLKYNDALDMLQPASKLRSLGMAGQFCKEIIK